MHLALNYGTVRVDGQPSVCGILKLTGHEAQPGGLGARGPLDVVRIGAQPFRFGAGLVRSERAGHERERNRTVRLVLQAEVGVHVSMTLVVEGAPRTKKTSNRLVRVRGRHVVLPSKANEDWTASAMLQLRAGLRRAASDLPVVLLPYFTQPVNVRALIYRDANRGDAVGYYQAIADALEAAGVVENDRLCVSWDGSRMLVDRARPRVEITLETAA